MKTIIALLIMSCAALPCSAQDVPNADLQAFKNGSLRDAGMAAHRLRKRYEAEGEDVLKLAVPTLAERVIREIKALEPPDKYLGEEGECLGDLIWLLSRSGDPRALEALISVMLSKKIGGRMVGEGLLRIGHAVLPDLMKHLGSGDGHDRSNAVSTLATMAEIDSTGVFFTGKDRKVIREKLLPFLADDELIMRLSSIRALGFLGDSADIPALEDIALHDPFKTETGYYIVRMAAEKAIGRLKRKE
ncbi:HEAT repeat domain-containing protein [Candidatus Latescibacterota bacterium]